MQCAYQRPEQAHAEVGIGQGVCAEQEPEVLVVVGESIRGATIEIVPQFLRGLRDTGRHDSEDRVELCPELRVLAEKVGAESVAPQKYLLHARQSVKGTIG